MKITQFNHELLKLISSLSGYMHDFGKANELFQSKIRGNDELADIVRHEFLSFQLIIKLVEMYENEILTKKDAKFITKEKWNKIFDSFDIQEKEFSFFKKNVQKLFDIQNDYYKFQVTQDVNPLTMCILLAVLTHHKLPFSAKNNNEIKNSLQYNSLYYYNTNRIEEIENKDLNKLKKNIQLHQNYYINKILEDKINDGFNKVYTQYDSIQNHSTDNKDLFFKSFSILSRIFLIMSDHHVSSIQKRKLLIDIKNADYSKTYANTNKDFDDPKITPTFNQTLDEHLLEVGSNTGIFLDELLSMQSNTPSLSENTIKKIMEKTSHNDFMWQNQAVDFIKTDNTDEPTLILNMGTTGSGKTRMNVKALGALTRKKLRFTSVFNLKSLTLQTGDAYKQQLGLKNNEISILIGDKNYLDIQTLKNNIEQKNLEEAMLDNDNQAKEQEYLIDGNFNSSEDWQTRPSFIKNKKKNGYKVDDFVGVPVLVSTIDFCINAGDLSQGSNHNNAFLRIMTSDLVIDEIDSYEPEMLESVLRLITMSAMNKNNVVISSATLSKHYIIMIKKAFEHGINLGNSLSGIYSKGKIIAISNLIQPKNIEINEDIDFYINSLCLEFCKNKQKMAKILYMQKKYSTPPIFKAIKELHLNHCQNLNDKKFSFGLLRVGQIKNAVNFAKKYINTNFIDSNYMIDNELVEVKFLTYHSNLINSQRFIVEEFLDNTLNQSTGSINNELVLNVVKNSNAKHIIFIIITTPVEEIGRDHDFHWGIIEPSSIQSIIQTAGRVNRHRKVTVDKPNIYILQYNLSYYYDKFGREVCFTKPGLERVENKYPQDIQNLLPWTIDNMNVKSLYITSELRYKSEFAIYDDKSILLSLNNLIYKFEDSSQKYWFRMEYYIVNRLRNNESNTYTYVLENNKFYQQIKDKKGNEKEIDKKENIYFNALELKSDNYKEKISTHPHLEQWSQQCDVSIYNDKQKENIRYNVYLGFYFQN